MTTETIDQILASDVFARFNISDTEAERIAGPAIDGADWLNIWENEVWWTDARSQCLREK